MSCYCDITVLHWYPSKLWCSGSTSVGQMSTPNWMGLLPLTLIPYPGIGHDGYPEGWAGGTRAPLVSQTTIGGHACLNTTKGGGGGHAYLQQPWSMQLVVHIFPSVSLEPHHHLT